MLMLVNNRSKVNCFGTKCMEKRTGMCLICRSTSQSVSNGCTGRVYRLMTAKGRARRQGASAIKTLGWRDATALDMMVAFLRRGGVRILTEILGSHFWPRSDSLASGCTGRLHRQWSTKRRNALSTHTVVGGARDAYWGRGSVRVQERGIANRKEMEVPPQRITTIALGRLFSIIPTMPLTPNPKQGPRALHPAPCGVCRVNPWAASFS